MSMDERTLKEQDTELMKNAVGKFHSADGG